MLVDCFLLRFCSKCLEVLAFQSWLGGALARFVSQADGDGHRGLLGRGRRRQEGVALDKGLGHADACS